jgi:hypothetical protein
MRTLRDWEGRAIRLTDERLNHIREHPEMLPMEAQIGRTLKSPTEVRQSSADPSARLYYRWYVGTIVGDKFLCVVVKIAGDDAFVVTAYLTDKVKGGERIWPRSV